ncbi:GTP-binding protein [Thalassobacillus sp. C254]|uniref:CobW family GTP-binding protein n=1 Tax=Thalassobacillus sp. C254 TaxID=1225341 RepID=UPI0006D1D047|nr:CobW-like GTP-binding protein [Thalassobacillus sp. C254]
MNANSTEIFILSGFLGSGKSTLLRRFLHKEHENGRQIAVLMNELGEKSIDSSVVPASTPLKEMLNGCICCTINGQLSQQLNSLLTEYKLDAIYIEATGAAHPIEIIDACTHPLLAGKVEIKSVLTLVDVKQWKEGRGV